MIAESFAAKQAVMVEKDLSAEELMESALQVEALEKHIYSCKSLKLDIEAHHVD